MPTVSYWLVLGVVFYLLKFLLRLSLFRPEKGQRFVLLHFPDDFFFIFFLYKYFVALHRLQQSCTIFVDVDSINTI
jgi:hypothetical protein